MAGRPTSQSMTYVPFDAYFDQDPKFKRLMIECGARGVYCALRVLLEVYRSNNGYFIERSEDLYFVIANDLQLKVTFVEQTVAAMARCGLLDEALFERHILTSRGIQKRWLTAMKRRKEYDYSKYWLLSDEETKSILGTAINVNNNSAFSINVDNNSINVDTNTTIKSNQIKGYDKNRLIKEKECACARDHHPFSVSVEDVKKLYQSYYGKRDMAKVSQLCSKYSPELVYYAIDKAGDRADKNPYKYIEQMLYAQEVTHA